MHVVHAEPILGDDGAQQTLIDAVPVVDSPLEVRQVLLGDTDGGDVVGHRHVDHTVGCLHGDGTHVLGRVHAEASALDHRGSTHADVRVLRGDDHVTASEERGIAGEAPARHDPDDGDESAQTGEEGEGHALEPRHSRVVGVARPSATALGEQHDRQPQPGHQLEQPVLLGMIALALGARQDRVVVRDHCAALAVDPSDAADQPVGGCLLDQLLH